MTHHRSLTRALLPTSLISLALTLAACGGAPEQDVVGDEADLRALKRNEIVGFMQYGDTASVAYSAQPLYRAYQFRANAFDKVVVTLTPAIPGTAVWATLLDENGSELTSGVRTDPGPNGATTLTYTMPAAFAERTVAFREKDRKNTKISVKLESSGVREVAVPFKAAPGVYQAPVGFRPDVQDVAMRCVSKSYYRPNSYAPEEITERQAQGTISLDFGSGAPKVVGGDDVFAPRQDYPELALERISLTKASEATNAISLTGKGGSTGSYRHLLQVSNVDNKTLRVEYAMESIGGNTGTRAGTLSCVGIQKL